MSDVTLLTQVVHANPAEATPVLMLADAIAERTGDTDAALVAARVEQAKAVLLANTKAGSRLRGALCRRVGATGRSNRPISTTVYRVVAGDAAPTYVGESYHFETPGGALVRYPNAYRRAYGKPVYCPAHHEITVGAEWLLANAAGLTA